jgi:hypothetical protein
VPTAMPRVKRCGEQRRYAHPEIDGLKPYATTM